MTFFTSRRARVRPNASSEQGQLHAGEYGEVVHQNGALEEGVRSYMFRLDSMDVIALQPDEVEILD